MRIAPVTQPIARATSVEPSRAWILGLVVDADGSLSDASPADVEWPSSTADAGAPRADHITSQDGSPVRP